MSGWAPKDHFDKINEGEAAGADSFTYKTPRLRLLNRLDELRKKAPNNLTAKYATPEYVGSLSDADVVKLHKVLKAVWKHPDEPLGCFAVNSASYTTFKPFFSQVIAEYHGIKPDATHQSSWMVESIDDMPDSGEISLYDFRQPPCMVRLAACRNMDFPLFSTSEISKDERIVLEQRLCRDVFANQEGEYFSLTPGHPNLIDDGKYQELVKAGTMFPNLKDNSLFVSAGIATDWPHGRGCFVSADKQIVYWVGGEDHLRIISQKKIALLTKPFQRLKKELSMLEALEDFKFANDSAFGTLTASPANLGTGLRLSVWLPLPHLTAGGTLTRVSKLCKKFGLQVSAVGGDGGGPEGLCDVSPISTFSKTEVQILKALYDGVGLLKAEEDKFDAKIAVTSPLKG